MTYKETSFSKRFIRKLKARDPASFEFFVKKLQRPVYNLLYRMLGSVSEAEDLAQEVFYTVFKKIDNFKGDSSLFTWVYRIAYNHSKNQLRYLSKRCQNQHVDYSDENVHRVKRGEIEISASMSGPNEVVEGLETEQFLIKFISAMREDKKLIFILRDIENLSYEEIASITGLARGTVKSRLHRARMDIKNALEKYKR